MFVASRGRGRPCIGLQVLTKFGIGGPNIHEQLYLLHDVLTARIACAPGTGGRRYRRCRISHFHSDVRPLPSDLVRISIVNLAYAVTFRRRPNPCSSRPCRTVTTQAAPFSAASKSGLDSVP
jgi:hypothetical protein